jgi:non-specific serine/threonine protein kinase
MDEHLTFGQWLKRRRRGLGLTQRTLGQLAGYSNETIRKVEADDQRPSRQMAERLAFALQIQPTDRERFVRFARDEGEPDAQFPTTQTVELPAETQPAAESRQHNLPTALTRFIGRKKEVSEIQELLGVGRLVTLTGPGGIGKSRLSLAVAASLVQTYRPGVRLVQLTSLTNPVLVSQTVAGVLDVRPEAGQALVTALADYLSAKEMLLVLDNCEHLVDACAQLTATLLQACPALRVLATSREPLAVPGEVLFRVPGLSLPENDQRLSPERLSGSEAALLFADRAAAALPGFAVSAANVSAVAEVCRRLDGMPLALELAAARVAVLRVEQIARRLDSRLQLLTDGGRTALPRHQTLRAAIDWSYNLLDDTERVVLRRAAAFVGGWSLEAAEAVCAGDGVASAQVLDVLVGLARKSMIQIERAPGREARYRMLETIREYASDRLAEADEAAGVRDRHLAFYLALGEAAAPHTYAADHGAWLERIRLEFANVRAALEWSISAPEKAEAGLRLVSALMRYWFLVDLAEEGARWLDRTLAAAGPLGAAPNVDALRLRARALPRGAYVVIMTGNLQRAAALVEGGLTLCRQYGSQADLGLALLMQAWTLAAMGDLDHAEPLFLESEALSHAAGERYFAAVAQYRLAQLAIERADYERATGLWEQILATCHELGDEIGIADTLNSQARMAAAMGHYPEATSLCRDSLARYRRLSLHGSVADVLVHLAELLRAQDEQVEAQGCLEEALDIYSDLGYRRAAAETQRLLEEAAPRPANRPPSETISPTSTADTRNAATK